MALAREPLLGSAIWYISQKLRMSPMVGRNDLAQNLSAASSISRLWSAGKSIFATYLSAASLGFRFLGFAGASATGSSPSIARGCEETPLVSAELEVSEDMGRTIMHPSASSSSTSVFGASPYFCLRLRGMVSCPLLDMRISLLLVETQWSS